MPSERHQKFDAGSRFQARSAPLELELELKQAEILLPLQHLLDRREPLL